MYSFLIKVTKFLIKVTNYHLNCVYGWVICMYVSSSVFFVDDDGIRLKTPSRTRHSEEGDLYFDGRLQKFQRIILYLLDLFNP